MSPIRVAIVGVGNCASSLVQGIHYYRDKTPENAVGLMHWRIGDYGPADLDIVAAFDIDARKVGRDVNEAIFALPNCTAVFYGDLPTSGVKVRMGRVLDGFSEHLAGLSGSSDVRSRDVPGGRSRRTRRGAARVARRGAAELPAGRLRRRGALLRGMCARGGRCARQLHAGVHRQRPGLGAALPRTPACRSSATTSRRNSAPRSRIGC